MSESILNTVIVSITAILVAVIGLGQLRTTRRTKGIEAQVVNSHQDKPGLRDDIDTLKTGLGILQRDVGGLREETRQVRREVYDQGVYGRENRHLIRELEKTQEMRKGKTNE